jgi:hypothetical protein
MDAGRQQLADANLGRAGAQVRRTSSLSVRDLLVREKISASSNAVFQAIWNKKSRWLHQAKTIRTSGLFPAISRSLPGAPTRMQAPRMAKVKIS